MEGLKLPIIKNMVPRDKIFSMDEYFKFVEFNLKYTIDKKSYLQWKKLLAVNVPFVFK